MRITSVETVFADGNHNAFTDLVQFRGEYYLAFRSCPDGHMIYSSSQIVILASADGVRWRERARFRVPGGDLRDPHFLATPDRLFVYSGCWPVTEGAPHHKRQAEMHSYVMYTEDGTTWSGPHVAAGSAGCYFWRTERWDGTLYITAKRRAPGAASDDPRDLRGFQTVLMASTDGFSWAEVSVIVPEFGDETALLFEPDGRLLALSRQRTKERTALWCASHPPYRAWERRTLSYNIGGPLLVKVGGRYLAAGRRIRPDEAMVTALYWFTGGDLVEFAVLPCHGDNGYPGFVRTGPGRGILSFYSNRPDSRPGAPPSDIHLARLEWEE